MRKELIIAVVVIALLASPFVVAKPNKDVYDAKESGNRSFVNIVDDNFPGDDDDIEGWVQYSKVLPHLHTVWKVRGLDAGEEYQLKITAKRPDDRLAYAEGMPNTGSVWMSGYWDTYGDPGWDEAFAVMAIVTADSHGRINYAMDYDHLEVGDYYDIQFMVTLNEDPWYSAWTWENSEDLHPHDANTDWDTDIHWFTITPATLMLYEKDPDGPDDIAGTADDWSIVYDGAWAELKYSKAGPQFRWWIHAEGLESETDYSIIYYADPWPGNNPGALIAQLTTDAYGVIPGDTDPGQHYASDGTELGMHLPHADDANYPTGAKIWLVKSDDYGCCQMTAWNPTEYLFENNLITYIDTDWP